MCRSALLLSALLPGVVLFGSCASETDTSVGDIRARASSVLSACEIYFARLSDFLLDPGESASALEKAIDGLYASLLQINLAVSAADTRGLYPESVRVVESLSNYSKLSESESIELMQFRVRWECQRWHVVSQLSDQEASSYFKIKTDDGQYAASSLCVAANRVALTIPTQRTIRILGCTVEETPKGRILAIELNDWLEWIDYEDLDAVPYGAELERYTFDYPLNLFLSSMRSAAIPPLDFGEFVVLMGGNPQTMYRLSPDITRAALLDRREESVVLLELRNQIEIYQEN